MMSSILEDVGTVSHKSYHYDATYSINTPYLEKNPISSLRPQMPIEGSRIEQPMDFVVAQGND